MTGGCSLRRQFRPHRASRISSNALLSFASQRAIAEAAAKAALANISVWRSGYRKGSKVPISPDWPGGRSNVATENSHVSHAGNPPSGRAPDMRSQSSLPPSTMVATADMSANPASARREEYTRNRPPIPEACRSETEKPSQPTQGSNSQVQETPCALGATVDQQQAD